MSEGNVYDIEKSSLDAHVTLCSERYRRLEDKFAVLKTQRGIRRNEKETIRRYE